MEWIDDREPFDAGATSRGIALAVIITTALTAFVVLLAAGVIHWASAIAGL